MADISNAEGRAALAKAVWTSFGGKLDILGVLSCHSDGVPALVVLVSVTFSGIQALIGLVLVCASYLAWRN